MHNIFRDEGDPEAIEFETSFHQVDHRRTGGGTPARPVPPRFLFEPTTQPSGESLPCKTRRN
jgi:hypothetical protein